ncbi:MAG TPA: nucleotidyltransferase domain-containing protein [Symbiobacteriaceae bacterium]|nr:nucleotidyltransferase domain-containing protein [Symbiobacteriaceae bacterium]
MSNSVLTRDQILAQLLQALQDQPDLLALWEAGSTATGRKDQYSDIDLMLLVKDGTAEALGALVEAALQALAPIDLKLEVPRPSWHGHWQTFWHLEGCPLDLQVDCCIMEESKGNRFLEPELHGTPLVYVDRGAISEESASLAPQENAPWRGAISEESSRVAPQENTPRRGGYTQVGPTDPAPIAAAIAKRLAFHRDRVALFRGFVAKELRRQGLTDAVSFYQGVLIQPIIELLRMAHDPWRYNFGARYLRHYLPEARLRQIERLSFVGSPEELGVKAVEAYELFQELVAELASTDWIAHLEAHR